MKHKNHNHYMAVSDKLLLSSINLSIVERRIVALAISKLNETKSYDSSQWFTFTVGEYASWAEVEERKAYDTIKETIITLISRKVYFETEKDKRYTTWFSDLILPLGTRTIRCHFSQIILGYISDLTERYTKEYLSTVFQFNKKYTWRLYDVIRTMDSQKEYEEIPRRKFTIEEFKYIFGIDKNSSYLGYGELRKHVLSPAIEELKKLEVAEVKVSPVREGRRVVGVRIERKLLENAEKKLLEREGRRREGETMEEGGRGREGREKAGKGFFEIGDLGDFGG